MITVPSNYNEVQAKTGDFEQLPPGGYVCRIISAKETTSSSHNPMLVLAIDIAEGEYAGFYDRAFKADTRENKKWRGVYNQMLTNESASYLKGLVMDLNASNNFEWDMDEAKLKGKVIGMLFRREEYEKQDGTKAFSVKPFQPRTVDKIRSGEFTIPEDKLLQGKKAAANYSKPLMEEIDEDLPF